MVALNSLNIGDIIELKAGEKIPVDGKIILGAGFFDESSILFRLSNLSDEYQRLKYDSLGIV